MTPRAAPRARRRGARGRDRRRARGRSSASTRGSAAQPIARARDRGAPRVPASTRSRSGSSARPHRYVAGEETALVNWLNGGDAKPTVHAAAPVRAGRRRPADARPERRDAGRPRADRPVRRRLVPLGRYRRRSRHDAGHAVGRGRAARRLRDPARRRGSATSSTWPARDRGDLSRGARRRLLRRVDPGRPRPRRTLGRRARCSRRAAGLGAGIVRRDAAGRRVRPRRERRVDALARRRERGAVRAVRQRARRHRAARWQRSSPATASDAPRRISRAGSRRCKGAAPASIPTASRASSRAASASSPTRSRAIGTTVRARASASALLPTPVDRRLAMSCRLVVNPITCVGHGLCAELFPERITLDDWGYPIIDPTPIPPAPRRPRAPRGRRVPDARAPARAGSCAPPLNRWLVRLTRPGSPRTTPNRRRTVRPLCRGRTGDSVAFAAVGASRAAARGVPRALLRSATREHRDRLPRSHLRREREPLVGTRVEQPNRSAYRVSWWSSAGRLSRENRPTQVTVRTCR